MTQLESKNFAITAKGLFPKMTDEQAFLLVELIAKFEIGRANDVLKSVAATESEFSLAKLMLAIRADAARFDLQQQIACAAPVAAPRVRIVDGLRRLGKWKNATDYKLIELHFSESRRAIEGATGDEDSKRSILKILRGECFKALREIEYSEAAASQISDQLIYGAPSNVTCAAEGKAE